MAQFFKRIDLDTYKQWAGDQDEAYLMRDAGEKVRHACADVGYAPR